MFSSLLCYLLLSLMLVCVLGFGPIPSRDVYVPGIAPLHLKEIETYDSVEKSRSLNKKITGATAACSLLCLLGAHFNMIHFPISSAIHFPTAPASTYMKYFLAGGACASFSHAVAVPVDVIKIRIQTAPDVYTAGVINTGNKIMREEGISMLFKGMGPTILGYSIHGSLKYGFYELFKPIILNTLSDFGWIGISLETKLIQFIISGIFAEIIASTAILPLEAARIRMIADPSFATGTIDSVRKVFNMEGNSSIYQSLPAILFKHIPFTVTQLTSFEFFTAAIYSTLGGLGLSPSDTISMRFLFTTIAALTSGILASLASQPGDTLLSRISSAEILSEGNYPVEDPVKKLVASIRDIGLVGLY
eukprot:gene1866-3620_t